MPRHPSREKQVPFVRASEGIDGEYRLTPVRRMVSPPPQISHQITGKYEVPTALDRPGFAQPRNMGASCRSDTVRIVSPVY